MKTTSHKRIWTFLLVAVLCSFQGWAQGGTCESIEPFCAGNQALIFPNCNNKDPDCVTTAEVGPDYACLFSQPYPAWFYLQIDQSGNLDFTITQNTSFDVNGNPTGTGLDVDFICWGPFAQGSDLCDYSQLQSANQIDCSYSALPVESFSINGGNSGDIYVLVITNWSQSPGYIKLEQTNVGSGGAGSTDCSILANETACDGDTITFDATQADGLTYTWTYESPVGSGSYIQFVPAENNPTLDVTLTGSYRCEVVVSVGQPEILFFEATFLPQPFVDMAPDDLFVCNNTGTILGEFDLTINGSQVIGSQDPAELVVTYLDGAGNPIADPTAHTITGTTETITIRLEELTGLCFAEETFDIIYTTVLAGPVANFEICDQDLTGSELVQLELLFDDQVLNGAPASAYTISYHSSQGDADNGLGALISPYLVSAPSEIIFVRFTSNIDPSCSDTTQSFAIIVATPPLIASPAPDLFQCSADVTVPGIFDLTQNEAVVLGGQDPADFNISFIDAIGSLIVNPGGYVITGELETITIRIEDLQGICFVEDVFDIIYTKALSGEVTDFNLCDTDNTGNEAIDLAVTFNTEVLDGQLLGDYFITYHETQIDADLGKMICQTLILLQVPQQKFLFA